MNGMECCLEHVGERLDGMNPACDTMEAAMKQFGMRPCGSSTTGRAAPQHAPGGGASLKRRTSRLTSEIADRIAELFPDLFDYWHLLTAL